MFMSSVFFSRSSIAAAAFLYVTFYSHSTIIIPYSFPCKYKYHCKICLLYLEQTWSKFCSALCRTGQSNLNIFDKWSTTANNLDGVLLSSLFYVFFTKPNNFYIGFRYS